MVETITGVAVICAVVAVIFFAAHRIRKGRTMITEPQHRADTPAEPAVLVEADRCDTARCGARAYVRVYFTQGFIDLCGHHFGAAQEALEQVACDIVDERSRLETV